MNFKEEVKEMKKEVKVMKEQSFAREILKDYKKQNKRQFIIILVILIMWFLSLTAETLYIVYLLNDIGTIETTSTQEVSQENTDGINNYIGNDGDITNGETNSKK